MNREKLYDALFALEGSLTDVVNKLGTIRYIVGDLSSNAAHLPNGAELDTPMPCEHKWLASTTTATGYKCVKCGQWTASP